MNRRHSFWTGCLAAAGWCVLASAQTIAEHGIEAQVNDKIITTSDVLKQATRRMEQLKQQKVPDAEQRMQELLAMARQELIESKLLEAEGERFVQANGLAKDYLERAVRVDMEDQRRQFKGEGPLLDHVEKNYGISYGEYRKRLWQDKVRQLVLEREVFREANVRPDEVQDYYQSHIEQFRTPMMVSYSQIYLAVESKEDLPRQRKLAEELVSRARAGESFAALVSDYSVGPRAGEGGRRELIRLDHLAEPLRKALGGMKPGDVSGPIVMEDAIRIVKAEKVVSSVTEPFEKVQTKIRKDLVREKQDKRYNDLLERLWRENYVWVREQGRVKERPGG